MTTPIQEGKGLTLRVQRTAQYDSVLGLCNNTGATADVRNRRLSKPAVWTAVPQPRDT